MIALDPASTVPPYAQIRQRVTDLVAAGDLEAGARLPTVRSLASELGLAVNTVARSYRELEAAGVVVTRGRHGTVVAESAPVEVKRGRTALRSAAERYVETTEKLGAGATEALEAVRRVLDLRVART